MGSAATSSRVLAALVRFPYRLHADQRGTISIISVFAILMLTMLLGMVMNVGRQADNKVRMQDAADAAAVSGAVVMSREMNTLAFTNHLLCDVFALTAFLREARDRHSEAIVPDILAAWNDAGESLSKAKFEKFAKLGPAIQQKVPGEQEMVRSYLAWATATSEAVLPLLEDILNQQLIHQYQAAVVSATPELAQRAANEAAQRHGLLPSGIISPERGPLQARLWGRNMTGLYGDTAASGPQLPVVDPAIDGGTNQVLPVEDYRNLARAQRRSLAITYLGQWNAQTLSGFLAVGRMSQFAALWSGFTCGQLEQLLSENQDRNLPLLIAQEGGPVATLDSRDRNAFLESNYSVVCVVYWPKATPYMPGVYQSPIDGDNLAYAQAMMFIPRNRLIRVWQGVSGPSAPSGIAIGGVPGEFVELPPTGTPQAPQGGAPAGGENTGEWEVVRENRPTDWNLLNQSWRAQLVPATHPDLATFLQTSPSFDGGKQPAQDVTLPNLRNLTPADLSVLSHH
ncbi:MAG: hypothetical protein K8T25_18835 [Planctomycetia bacterium]|nr:hypothetical protein [Planctomycetia bacterium]